MLALPENHRVSQGRDARRDMHRTAPGKVERREVIQPPGRVPRPTGQGAVDDRRPAEAEDQGWNDVSTFEGTPDNDHDLERYSATGIESRHRVTASLLTVQAQKRS